jgi:Ner family transcriptional regulator
MATFSSSKKAAPGDWHPADIVAALRKAGWSLRRLSKHHGYHPQTLGRAMRSTYYPSYERLIAKAIGVKPEQIWPARFRQRRLRQSTPRARNGHASASGGPGSSLGEHDHAA